MAEHIDEIIKDEEVKKPKKSNEIPQVDKMKVGIHREDAKKRAKLAKVVGKAYKYKKPITTKTVIR